VHDDVGLLVEDDEVLILEEDLERDVFGLDPRGRGLGDHDLDDVAAAEVGGRFGGAVVDHDAAAGDELLQLVAAHERDAAGEVLVNASVQVTLQREGDAADGGIIFAEFGIAAVAEARGKLDDAKKAYEQVIKIAEYSGLTGQAEIAKKRIEDLPKLTAMPKLLATADLPKPPEPPKPADPTQPVGGAVYDPSAAPVTAPTGATPAPTGGAPAPETPAPTGTEPPKPEQPAATTPEAPKPADPKPAEPK